MKKVICIALTLLIVLLTVAPAFALTDCVDVRVYDFDRLQEELESLSENQRINIRVCKDIVFTDTIEISADGAQVEFFNDTEAKEAKFIIDGLVGIDINTYTPNVKLYFNDVVFGVEEYSDSTTECGIEISKYSDGCLIDGATFSCLSNVDSDGAGIYVNAEDCTINNCTFSKCRASYGAGIYINNDIVTVDACTFDGCFSMSYGAGVYSAAFCSGVEIKNCSFNCDSRKTKGACVYGYGENYVKVIDCTPKNGGDWCYYGCEEINTKVGSILSTGSLAVITTIVVLSGIATVIFIRRKKSNEA